MIALSSQTATMGMTRPWPDSQNAQHRLLINQACFERRLREARAGAERKQTPLAQ
jgi:hypothetical protein